jgi:hypothetical protein
MMRRKSESKNDSKKKGEKKEQVRRSELTRPTRASNIQHRTLQITALKLRAHAERTRDGSSERRIILQ